MYIVQDLPELQLSIARSGFVMVEPSDFPIRATPDGGKDAANHRR
jgi:hypothetical protein